MRRLRAAQTMAVLAATATLGVGLPAPADAAVGVRGAFTFVNVYQDSNTCPQGGGCNYTDFVSVETHGWAYNAKTKPSQQVYVSAQYDRVDHGRARVATATRNDVKKRYHLSTAKVGFSDLWSLDDQPAFKGAPYKVCLHARDRGGKEPWRTVQCVKAKVK